MTEAEWQALVIDLAHQYGWEVMHVRRGVTKGRWTTNTSVAGWVDLTLWKAGRGVLFRELKTDTGKLSADQTAVLGSLRAAGANTGIWRPADLEAVTAELRA